MNDSTSTRFWRLARQAKWIAALVLVLAVAAAFAGLGRWQLERSLAASVVNEVDTETVVPLTELATPAVSVTGEQLGRVVSVSGQFVPEDTLVLASRLHDGDTGYWTVARLLVEAPDAAEPVSLAVALGWSATEAEARAAAPDDDAIVELQGRYLPSEAPRTEDLETGERSAVSIADFVNVWSDYRGTVYGGYLISDTAPAGLTLIYAPAPLPEASVNLLNLFYALEWLIFAGFAFYLWYRLVMDEVEKEVEAATVD